jgi:hypothetical protein
MMSTLNKSIRHKSARADKQLIRYLEKIWNSIFDEGSSGLLSPAQLLRENSSRTQVRAQELSHIALAEKELQAISQGRKSINEWGLIKETARNPEENVLMSPIIEKYEGSSDDVELRLGAHALLKHISHEVRLSELKRSLHIRKIALFAEKEAYKTFNGYFSDRAIDIDWLERWKSYAKDTHGRNTQKLLARVLVKEVKQPGSISIFTLDFIRHLSAGDVELINIVAKFCFEDFIYRDAKGYLTDEIHGVMFEHLEELGLIEGVTKSKRWLDLGDNGKGSAPFNTVLRCRNKALFIDLVYSGQSIHFPVYPLTRIGKELVSVSGVDADSGYLWAVANNLKLKGCAVQLGDWLEKPGSKGVFQERITI